MFSFFIPRRMAARRAPFMPSQTVTVLLAAVALAVAIVTGAALVSWQIRAGMTELALRSLGASALVSILAVCLLSFMLIRQVQDRQAHLAARRQQAAALAAEKVMLEAIATSYSPMVLDTICRAVEMQMPNSLCSILLFDPETRQLHHGAAPNLPREYSEAIDGVVIGPNVGSCGTAAHLGRRVIVSDITTDPLWADYREVAARFGFRACWSTPIHSSSGSLLGTFAIYAREPRTPSSADLGWAERATHLAGIAIERGRAEQTMAAAKEEAERANRAKSVFLANMSHELRTPLNAIIGFSEGLGSGALGTLPEPQQAYLRDIHHAGKHLLELINDLLDLSRIDAGKLRLDEDMIDVEDVLRLSAVSLASTAAAAKVEIAVAPTAGLPRLQADRARVSQVVTNLLSNAIKFSRIGGRVTLQAGLRSDGALDIAIADTGVGMSPAEIGIALEPFRQVNGSRARPQNGAGLGLPLAKQLIELHGGRLEVDSMPGTGTTVHVIFPRTRAVPATLAALVETKQPT